MMRFKVVVGIAFVLAFLVAQDSQAETSWETVEPLTPLDFDQAVQVLESSTRDNQSFWLDQFGELMQEHDLSFSELLAETDHHPEIQARMSQMENIYSGFEQSITQAVRSMLDPIHRARLTVYLESTDTLRLLSFLQSAAGVEMTGRSIDKSEFPRVSVSDLVEESPALQDRLIDLMFDERSLVTLALSANKQHPAASLFDEHDVQDSSFSVGQRAIFPAMRLLPTSRLTGALAQATRPAQDDRLPDYLKEMIESNILLMFHTLPFDWLVEQVEAGSLIWLNSLAMTDDGNDHPLLFEHFDQLNRSQQLQLIAINPQTEFVPVLRDAWQDAMDAAWCDGCGEPVDSDQIESLIQGMMTWETDESAEMLTALMAIDRYAEIVSPWRGSIANMAMASETDAFVRLGMDMARNDGSLTIRSWVLGRLHRFDADAMKEIARMRVEHWSDEPDAGEHGYSHTRRFCDRAALGLYADGQGHSVDWRQWLPVGDEGANISQDNGCFFELAAAALADTKNTASLTTLLTEMEATGLAAYHFDHLTGMAGDAQSSQTQRDVLAMFLLDHPAWDSLSESSQDWLLGIEPRKRSQLSCQSNEEMTEFADED